MEIMYIIIGVFGLFILLACFASMNSAKYLQKLLELEQQRIEQQNVWFEEIVNVLYMEPKHKNEVNDSYERVQKQMSKLKKKEPNETKE